MTEEHKQYLENQIAKTLAETIPKKRTEYYREWEEAHREERNAYRRKLYRLKRDQLKMNI